MGSTGSSKIISHRHIAQICHEANKAVCEAAGDFTQKSWDEAEEWQQESAINGVKYAIENPDAPASAQHDAWLKDKVEAGWVWGEKKDPVKKTHPCMVAFDALPFEQKVKDHVFKAIVRAMS
jgi:hypothetical protein